MALLVSYFGNRLGIPVFSFAKEFNFVKKAGFFAAHHYFFYLSMADVMGISWL